MDPSKKSSSTETSDNDDDDNPMLKIDFKINPKTQISLEDDGEIKILDAMRLVDKNLSNIMTNSSRLLPNVKQEKQPRKLIFVFCCF